MTAKHFKLETFFFFKITHYCKLALLTFYKYILIRTVLNYYVTNKKVSKIYLQNSRPKQHLL